MIALRAPLLALSFSKRFMKKIAVLGLFYFMVLFQAHGVQVTIDWPHDALGNYSLPGITPKPMMEKGTYEIPEGANARLSGDGFSTNFTVKYGKVQFPLSTGSVPDSTGVRFDPATNTFSFITVDIHVVKKNYDGDVSVDAAAGPKSPPSPDGTYKVVYGVHTLYGPERLDFRVDSHDVILLMQTMTGVTSRGLTIFVEGLPLEVTPTGAVPWTIVPGLPAGTKTGNATVYLVPNERGYAFQSTAAHAPFFLNQEGLLSLQKEGPYAEFVSLPDGTKIGVPGGEAKYEARLKQEQADSDLRQKVLTASAAAAWKKDFNLVEKMKLCDFPEEQLSYPVDLPAGVDPKELKLLEFTEKWVREIPFQLSPPGNAATARTIYFRSDLPLGGSRLFRLMRNYGTAGIRSLAPQAPALRPSSDPADSVIFNNGLLSVKAPSGHHDFSPAMPLAQVPAPILAVARGAAPEAWATTGSFVAPDSLLVVSMDAKAEEQGPLFLIYKVTYHLTNGKDYAVDLEQCAGDAELRVGETLGGFMPEDQAYLRLDYSKGLNPDRRLAASNGGYDLYGGSYDRNATTDGSKAMWSVTSRWLDYDPKLDSSPVPELNFRVGLFSPNNLNVVRTVCFYNEMGKDALLVSAMRLRDWQTPYRELWTSFRGPENFRFYADGPKKYLQAGLSGTKRFWALSLIPREEVTLRPRPGSDGGARSVAAGPEVWLNSKLTAWSLNAYKDRAVDWDEKLDATPFDHLTDSQTGKPYHAVSFDDYVKTHLQGGLRWMLNFQEDFGGGLWTRGSPPCFGDYACSRAAWTPEQREQIRQILVMLADYCEGDDSEPHHSMMGGHPNFVSERKMVLPIAAATFPNHPQAKMWRDSFMQFYSEFMDRYERKDVPELNTVGGRWTENIACYVGACYFYLMNSQEALKAYDGTSLGKNPQLLSLIRWMRDAMMSPQDGVRMIPPEGAHSHSGEPGMPFYNCFFAFCQDLAADDPLLAREMQWIQTNGAQGTKPDIHSALYTDYGPVFHYDFGGPHESYAHMQIINGISYRWGHAGIVYYGAKNKVWSYNGSETNGDGFDWNSLSAFIVNDDGLRFGPTDQLLYDFDFAQFYRHAGREGDDYQARGLMLLRDDYLVLSDEVKNADVAGTFNWVSLFSPPQIYQIKPGAPQTQRPAQEFEAPRSGQVNRQGQVLSYSGKGDFLTVVAPAAVQAEAKPFGAMLNGEYVFASSKPEEITQGTAFFSGTYGYARPNQLALFQGTKIGLDGFTLRRDGGDFGVSAAAEPNKITGRIVGRSGGKILLVPPTGFDVAKASVSFDGQPIPHAVEEGAIVFSVSIAQKDGLKNYAITFLK